MKKAAFLAFQIGVPVAFVLVTLSGLGIQHPLATTIAIFVAFGSWLWLMENDRFRRWARGEGGWIAHWFG